MSEGAILKEASKLAGQEPVLDHNVQVIPHFGPGKLIALTVRLQPLRNEVIDKVLEILKGEMDNDVVGQIERVIEKVEALRGSDANLFQNPETCKE